MSINSKSTKAEILAAYKELEKEKKELETKVNEAKKQATINDLATTTITPKESSHSYSSPNPVNPPNPKSPNNETLNINPMNNFTISDIDQVIKSLQQLQVSFGGAVSQLSEKLITEATALEKLQTEIEMEVEQLQELHDLDNVDDETLNTLINTYEETVKNFAHDYNEREENLRQELETLVKEWQKEQENKQREIKTRNETYQKNKQRDEEEYRYNLQLERQIDLENNVQELNSLYKVLEDTRKQQEKDWEEREKTISEKEKNYQEVKAKVQEFEARLEAEIKKAKEEGKGIGTYQGKVKADVRQKEIQGETQNYQLRIQALESTIANNENRINNLSKQLDSALKQVQDLAVKAIEGASNRSSFEAMKEVALEQAKNQQKSK